MEEPFLHILVMDRQGGGKELDASGLADWRPEQGILWVHLDYTNPGAIAWLEQDSGLHEVAAQALMQEEPRPRSSFVDGGLMVVLRGVNLNPGAEPEEMVSIRIWLDTNRVITSRKRHIPSVDDLVVALREGNGPASSGGFLVDLAGRTVMHMADALEDVEDQVDAIEDQVVTAEGRMLRPVLADLRRQIITLRRYIAPQREMLTRLQTEKTPLLSDEDRLRIREIGDRVSRYVEDLEEARDRAAVTHEELSSRLSEQLDRRIYILSVLATIFLPLTFLTGLFGINVGGIPGAQNEQGFAIVAFLLILLAVVQLAFIKWRKWL